MPTLAGVGEGGRFQGGTGWADRGSMRPLAPMDPPVSECALALTYFSNTKRACSLGVRSVGFVPWLSEAEQA